MLKPFLSNSYRKSIDHKINQTINSYKKTQNRYLVSSKAIRQNTLGPLQPVKQEYLTKINPETAVAVYIDRCNELEVVPNQEAQKRFVPQFLDSFHNKTFAPVGLGLGSSCIRHIITLVNSNPQYISLDLSLNQFKDDCIIYLSRFLYIDPPIINLSLRSNGIGSSGTSYLFQALCKNTHLISLDLSAVDNTERNRIGIQGCQALSKTLLDNQVLAILILSMCGITADACSYLSTGLSQNNTLIHLDLASNN